MKKLIPALSLAAIILLCGCGIFTVHKQAESPAAPDSQSNGSVLPIPSLPGSLEPIPEPTDIPDPNSETMYSLLERVQSNKDTDSFEGFTGDSTIIDVVDKIGADNIWCAALSYRSELVGYPAVVQYIFDKSRGGTLALTSMYFYIMPEQQGGFKDQLQKLAGKLEAGLGDPSYEASGDHELGNKYPDYSWDRANYSVILTSEGQFTSEGVLAFVHFTPLNDSDIPDMFPGFAAGTDIHTVYDSETPVPGLEEITLAPWAYNLYYSDKGTSVNLIFKVQGTEIKLCQAGYSGILPDTGNEHMDKCFKSFADRMEEIFGPAASRLDSPVALMRGDPPQSIHKAYLHMDWPGVKTGATFINNDSPQENYHIDIIFFGEYFAAK